MNQCPVCSTEIQDSFGLIECPGCKKILFADFDGALKVQEDSPLKEEALATHEEVSSEENVSGFNDDWNSNSPETSEAIPSLDVLDPVEPVSSVEFGEEAQFEEIVSEESLESPKLDMIEEVHQFANSEASSLKEGAFIYTLKIKNIDTEDLKEEILDVLKENKLNIDVQNLKFSLPTLELKDLNPVKVSVIVSRIKHLPVDVEWTQTSAITGKESKL